MVNLLREHWNEKLRDKTIWSCYMLRFLAYGDRSCTRLKDLLVRIFFLFKACHVNMFGDVLHQSLIRDLLTTSGMYRKLAVMPKANITCVVLWDHHLESVYNFHQPKFYTTLLAKMSLLQPKKFSYATIRLVSLESLGVKHKMDQKSRVPMPIAVVALCTWCSARERKSWSGFEKW